MTLLNHRPSRRRFIALALAGAGASLLSACASQSAAPPSASKPDAPKAEAPKPTSAPAAAPTTVAAPTTAAAAKPAEAAKPAATTALAAPAAKPAAAAATDELKVGVGYSLPNTVDVKRSPDDGWRTINWNMGETLMRLSSDVQLEPGLAEKVENVDPQTWRITLRPNVTFWDGSPLTAKEVEASIKESWEKLASASTFISKDTQISIVDDRTLTMKTPQPVGELPYSLATQHFVIHKRVGDAVHLTGQYKPIRFELDQFAELEPYAGYWGPPGRIKKVTARLIADAGARSLAFQSGDLDMLWRYPPRQALSFGSEFEAPTRAAARTNMVMFNVTRPPFNDRAVREAMSLGIDRNALLQIAYDGLSAVTAGMFPTGVGVDVVDAQAAHDMDRAKKLLDDAGWKPGPDGVRAKGSDKIAFTLYSYKASNDEFTPMATAIQEQLKPLGFAIDIKEVRGGTEQAKDGEFQAIMWSLGVLVIGDPQYLFSVALVKGGAYNFGQYSNPALEELMPKWRAEADLAKRKELSRQAQTLVKDDYPYLYLNAAPISAAYRKGKLSGYTLHPIDLYFMSQTMAVS